MKTVRHGLAAVLLGLSACVAQAAVVELYKESASGDLPGLTSTYAAVLAPPAGSSTVSGIATMHNGSAGWVADQDSFFFDIEQGHVLSGMRLTYTLDATIGGPWQVGVQFGLQSDGLGTSQNERLLQRLDPSWTDASGAIDLFEPGGVFAAPTQAGRRYFYIAPNQFSGVAGQTINFRYTVQFDVQDATAALPLPGSMPLVLAGLAGLVVTGASRRRPHRNRDTRSQP